MFEDVGVLAICAFTLGVIVSVMSMVNGIWMP